MEGRMKRKESLDSKPKGNRLALEIDQEENKRKKMVVTFFSKGNFFFCKWISSNDGLLERMWSGQSMLEDLVF